MQDQLTHYHAMDRQELIRLAGEQALLRREVEELSAQKIEICRHYATCLLKSVFPTTGIAME